MPRRQLDLGAIEPRRIDRVALDDRAAVAPELRDRLGGARHVDLQRLGGARRQLARRGNRRARRRSATRARAGRPPGCAAANRGRCPCPARCDRRRRSRCPARRAPADTDCRARVPPPDRRTPCECAPRRRATRRAPAGTPSPRAPAAALSASSAARSARRLPTPLTCAARHGSFSTTSIASVPNAATSRSRQHGPDALERLEVARDAAFGARNLDDRARGAELIAVRRMALPRALELEQLAGSRFGERPDDADRLVAPGDLQRAGPRTIRRAR